ncbi:site-specific DNA-methyltransferase [Leifsonia xyli]|uniref:site-specific DNA-methyltransferase n=1 Tax=Leifsonia xyli TaxID=1575 RepID=UPI003D66A469
MLTQLRAISPALAVDIGQEFEALTNRRAFGLNFERHAPEAVELPGRRARVGDKVRVQPPRGDMPRAANSALFRVAAIKRTVEGHLATVEPLGAEFEGAKSGTRSLTVPVDDLVVIAEFRDPIYPGLVSTGKVERGGDKPYHAVINAENFHALQTLLFTHRGKVDAIYIDPPYNTGARDWKYNNDYVEGDDLYRHSKWLAFLERRLLLAKELLNPHDSVLIVTIDEKEVHRLGLLVAQTFPEARVQMVTTVTNQRGVARGQEFARVDEYAIVVLLGGAQVTQGPDDMLTSDKTQAAQRVDIWNRLMRRGSNSARSDRPGLFYPIYVDPARRAIVDVGEPLRADQHRSEAPARPGLDTVLPKRTNGDDGYWTVGPETLRKNIEKGYVRVGARTRSGDSWSISYLISKDIKRVENGEIRTLGRDANGALLLELDADVERTRLPRTVWNRDRHNAGTYGSELLGRLIPGRKFPFPKSLYLVEDMLRAAVGGKPDATVIDFFSGSGTTAHAVMRLNKQDGGSRSSILVTNNEVGSDEQKALRAKGLRPGDAGWEQWGICDYVTKPRIRAAITGETPEGQPVKGEYRFTDVFPMADGFEENVEFFTLTYEAPMRVQSHREFARIAPFLWLRAGSRGRRIDSLGSGWDVAEAYGVLADLDQTDAFIEAMSLAPDATVAFIVTDEDRLFEAVVRDLPDGVEPVRMYEAYLRNFEIDAMRSVR